MNYIYLGKIVNTHGLKGELRIISQFKYKNKVFIENFKLYIGKKKEEEIINSYRPHKNFDMICLKGYSNINEVLRYKGLNVYVNSEDLNLNNNEYLDEDLIDLKVYLNDKFIGIVKRIDNYNGNEIISVNNGDNNYLIPYNFDIIDSINLKEKKMFIKDIKGLIV